MAFATGYRIVLRAVADIFSNLPAALRISLPWCMPLAILTLLLDLNIFYRLGMTGVGKTLSIVVFIAFLGYVAISIPALAISWHRFILRGQPTDRLFKVDWSWPLMSYLFNMIAVALFSLLAVVPLWLLYKVASGVMPQVLADMIRNGTILPVTFAATVWLYYLVLRLSFLLPAIALEERGINFEANQRQHTFKWSWQTTKPHASSILVIAAILMALGAGVEVANNVLVGNNPSPGGSLGSTVGYALFAAMNWFWLILNISILTTLYGYICLNKPLISDERAAQASHAS